MGYAAFCGVVLTLSYFARLRVIFAAAQLLTAGWIASVAAWRFLDDAELRAVLVLQDAVLAYVFFQMSRGRWFPVALFAIHVLMLAHNLMVAVLGVPDGLISLFLNRLFELALVYVGGCALYRIRVRRMGAVTEHVRQEKPPP